MIRALGALLLLLSLGPAWSLLDRPEVGLAGAVTADAAAASFAELWLASALVALLAVAAGFVIRPDAVTHAGHALAAAIERPSTRAFAAGAAALGALVTFALQAVIGEPSFIDAVAQSAHARYWADGRLAGPVTLAPGIDLAFWHVPNTLATARGWVSQYPPGHILLLALGYALGAASLVPPLLSALMVYAVARLADDVIDDRAAARAGTLLVAASPFLAALAAAGMNHVTAAAFGALALWLAGTRGRALLVAAGVALGVVIATRPLTGVVFALLATVRAIGTRTDAAGAPTQRASPVARVSFVAGGAALPVALLLAYNAHFFGAPARFGYEAALGPNAGLGWGVDPWGNRYGGAEAFAWSVTELQSLGGAALETPVSIVALVAAGLLALPAAPRGARFLLAWALLPVAAQMTYWHHGLWMGPRMLYEAVPAWILLAALVGVALIRAAAERLHALRFSPRVALAAGCALSLAGALALRAPERIGGYASSGHADRALATAAAAAPGAVLAFVHGSWTDRLTARLAALGMRADSIETALRQNPTCAVESYARARASGAPLPPLDLEPRATRLPRQVMLEGGTLVRVDDRAPLPECTREAAADRAGVISMAPLLVRGALPGTVDRAPLFVRDLGPERNAALIAALPDRVPVVLVGRNAGNELILDVLPHERAMRELWQSPTPNPETP